MLIVQTRLQIFCLPLSLFALPCSHARSLSLSKISNEKCGGRYINCIWITISICKEYTLKNTDIVHQVNHDFLSNKVFFSFYLSVLLKYFIRSSIAYFKWAITYIMYTNLKHTIRLLFLCVYTQVATIWITTIFISQHAPPTSPSSYWCPIKVIIILTSIITQYSYKGRNNKLPSLNYKKM